MKPKFITKFQLLLLATLFNLSYLAAQNIVSGSVRATDTKDPLVDAKVAIKSTTISVQTDADGKFSLNSAQPFPWTLLVSYTGFKTQEVIVNDATNQLTIALTESPMLMSEIVVSASRRAEKIEESPTAVSIISSKKLQLDNVANPMLSLRNMVGVDIAQYGVGEGQITLRGRNAAFNTETFVIADYRNILLPSFGAVQYGQQPIDPIDLDRIEVVRGAGGALYGPGVESGVVHFISKTAFKEQGTTLSLGGGNRNQLQGAFRYAGIDKSGKLGYKLTGFYRSAKDFEADTINDAAQRARIGAYPKQITSSIDGSKVADGTLDYNNKSMGLTGSLEYKFTDKTTLTAVGGFGQANSLIKLGQGDGFTKAIRPFAQLRLQSGRFFAQTFWSKQMGKDGESWLYPTGLTTVNIINQLEGQAQYEISGLNNKLKIVTGADYRLNTIDTKGTVNGRNENSDDYLIYGAYAQAKYALTSNLDVVGAARLDRFDALKATAVSPRIGLVFKAADNHVFRATFNHSVGSPTSLQLVNDLAAGNRGAFLIWLNAGSQPMTFDQNRYYSFVTSTTSNSPNLGAKLAYNQATAGLIAAGVPKALTDYLTRVTPNIAGTLTGTLATQPISRGAIGLSSSSMYEFGYKGSVNNKWAFTLDLYYTKRDNNLTTGQQAGSLVVFANAGTELASIVAAAIPADSAAKFGRTPAQIGAMYKSAVESLTLKNGVPSPLGLLSSDQSPTGKTLDLTYFNLDAIDYWGTDLGINYNFDDNLSFFANYSHLNKVYWDKAKVKNSTSTVPFSLNQPGDRFRIGADYVRAKGLLFNVAFRYASAWKGINGAAWSGDISASSIVDAGVGYAFSPKMKINITATNLLDADYRVLANAPFISRLILAKGTVSF